MSGPRIGRGFTLVELLVVIAIIGTLVGLLLPAIQSAREASRSMACRNNLTQLKTALATRETTLGELPGYVNNLGQRGTVLQVRASWIVTLFPYLEQQALWDRWSDGRVSFVGGKLSAEDQAYLDLLVCPSDPPTSYDRPHLSYVANAGCMKRSQSSCEAGDFEPAEDSPFQEIGENPGNGLFFDRSRHIVGSDDQTGPPDFNDTATRPEPSITTNYVQAKGDGTTYTLMLAENTRAVHWAFVDEIEYSDGPASVSGATSDDKHHFGFLWEQPDAVALGIAEDTTLKELRINGGREDTSYENYTRIKDMAPEDGFPASHHPGGVNVAFLGGAVRYLSDQIALKVYAQIMTCNRNQTDLSAGGVPEKHFASISGEDF